MQKNPARNLFVSKAKDDRVLSSFSSLMKDFTMHKPAVAQSLSPQKREETSQMCRLLV